MTWKRFVALGDSLTEGVGDPRFPGGLAGWAEHLAAGLRLTEPDLVYVNLARRSLRTADILDTQVPVALGLEPDLVSAFMGMNDLVRPDFDAGRFHSQLSRVVAPFCASDATVVMGSFADTSSHLLARQHVRSSIRRRLEQAGEVTRSVAEDHGALFVDGWSMAEARGSDVLSIDRLHPNRRGHLMIARAVADELEAAGGEPIDLPVPGPGRLLSFESALHLGWLARNLGPAFVRQVGRLVGPGR
jgi:lysophospholipase L1-like esterase